MRHPITGLASVLLCLSAAFVAGAAPVESVEKVFLSEAGGTLEVAPDGSVAKVTIGEGIDEPLRTALSARIGKLRFEPVLVHGEAVQALTGFHVVLEGRPQGGQMAVTIDAIEFVTPKGMTPVAVDGEKPGDMVGLRLDSPKFPRDQQRSAQMARVKLAMRIDAGGKVADVAVIDSMLIENGSRHGGSPAEALRQFEKESEFAARRWTFKVPPGLDTSAPRQMTVVTDVEFVFALREGVDLHKPGQWLPMLRAPKRAIAWVTPEQSRQLAETAVAAGSVGGGESAFRLKDPIAGTPVL